MNSIYQQMNQGSSMNGFVQKFKQFQHTFSGDPREQIQRLMNSGRISQAQYNSAYQTAQQMMRILNSK